MSAPPEAEPPAAGRWPLLSPTALMARVVDHFAGVQQAPQPASGASKAPKKPPPALTLDRDGFLARLVSFKTGEHAAAWAAQPAAIGPVACARHGWLAAPGRPLTVTCRECTATLTCKARPMPWESRDEAAKVLAPKLQESHNAMCPWRSYTFGADEAGREEQERAAVERKEEEARRAAAAAAELPVRDVAGL